MSHTWGSTWEAGKGSGVLDCVVGRRRKRETAGQPGVKQMTGAKEIKAPTLARRSLPSKGLGQVGTTRKEWVKGIPLEIHLSGGFW